MLFSKKSLNHVFYITVIINKWMESNVLCLSLLFRVICIVLVCYHGYSFKHHYALGAEVVTLSDSVQ